MTLKSLWYHYITSDLNLPKDDSRFRRIYLINILSLVMILALSFYIFFNVFYTKLFLLAFIEIAVLIFAFIPICILRRLHNVELAATLVTINLFILMVLFIYMQKNNDYALAQAVFLPTFAIFLKGKRFGIIYSLIFISIILYIAWSGLGVWEPAPYNLTSFINLTTTYILIIGMLYYFESSRKEAFEFVKEASERAYQNNLKLHEKSILLEHANKELMLFKTDFEGNVDGMLTEKRAQEEILVQESKMASMGEMISVITHQWEQPLAVATDLVSNIKREESLCENTDATFLKNIEKLETQLNYMNQTILDFSNFFKPTKSKEHFTIATTILNVIQLLQSQFNSNDISIQTQFDDDSISIESYKNEFTQVIFNLLSNAKSAIDKQVLQGGLEKGKGEIQLHLFRSGSKIYLTIEDNAGGIDPQIMNKIFNPYFTTKKDNNGTGIGLYMSKITIQERMHGSLDVRNGEKGAIFTIIL